MRNRNLYILVSTAFMFILCGCQNKSSGTPEIITKVDTLYISTGTDCPLVSIQEFGVLPGNSPAQNKKNLQAAIDKATTAGIALYVEPVEDGYPIDGGIVLKRNVSLIGAHGPTGRGTRNKAGTGPTGSLFVITDESSPFLIVESATRVQGIQFYYPEQTWNNPAAIKQYKPTIQMSSSSSVHGVTLRDLSFYGEYFAMDFRAPESVTCEQILFENCYGYPLSGQFIALDRCYDIPRILHCHVNPANMREFGRSFTGDVMQKVIDRKTYAYWINRTDNAVAMDIFTFATYGGIWLGESTYGELTSFNFDCVGIGIYKGGAQSFNRNWQVSQGSIIANLGTKVEDIHPIYIDGEGHMAITNVESFSGQNGALTSIGASYDFITVDGDEETTVSMLGCRMRNYTADFPITIKSNAVKVRAVACVDRNSYFFDYTYEGEESDLEHDVTTTFNDCESAAGWASGLGSVSVDGDLKTEGNYSVTAGPGQNQVMFRWTGTPVDSKADRKGGHLLFDLYISDISKISLSGEGAIEITSSGEPDSKEYAWMIGSLGLKSGWNSLDLKFSDARVTGSSPDLAAINFFRIYHLAINDNITVKIDNMRFHED